MRARGVGSASVRVAARSKGAKVFAATWQRCKVHFIRIALAHAGNGQRQVAEARRGG